MFSLVRHEDPEEIQEENDSKKINERTFAACQIKNVQYIPRIIVIRTLEEHPT